MKKACLFLFIFLININFSFSQDSLPERKELISFGLEQDVLPYVLGGFFISGWMGKGDFRVRFSYAESKLPKFFRSKDISQDKVEAFGISFEYCLKKQFRGLWFSAGIGAWTNRIQADSFQAVNNSIVFSLGGGYNYRIWRGLYFTPWVAFHTRMSGRDAVPVGNTSYKPALFTPEISIKLGWRFTAYERTTKKKPTIR